METQDYINNLVFPSLLGVVAYGISFVKEIAKNTLETKLAIKDLSNKIENLSDNFDKTNEVVEDLKGKILILENTKLRR